MSLTVGLLLSLSLLVPALYVEETARLTLRKRLGPKRTDGLSKAAHGLLLLFIVAILILLSDRVLSGLLEPVDRYRMRLLPAGIYWFVWLYLRQWRLEALDTGRSFGDRHWWFSIICGVFAAVLFPVFVFFGTALVLIVYIAVKSLAGNLIAVVAAGLTFGALLSQPATKFGGAFHLLVFRQFARLLAVDPNWLKLRLLAPGGNAASAKSSSGGDY